MKPLPEGTFPIKAGITTIMKIKCKRCPKWDEQHDNHTDSFVKRLENAGWRIIGLEICCPECVRKHIELKSCNVLK